MSVLGRQFGSGLGSALLALCVGVGGGGCGSEEIGDPGLGDTNGQAPLTTGVPQSTTATSVPGGTGGESMTTGVTSGSGVAASTTGSVEPSMGDGGAPAATPDEWCAASKVFAERCQTCHSDPPIGGAPMALVTHDDTQATSKIDGRVVHEVVADRVHDSASPMPPVASGSLTPEELAALDAWAAAGAPPPPAQGCGDDAADPTDVNKEVEWPEECEEFYEIRAEKHVVKAGTESRMDFNVPVPWTGQVYALALRPIANNVRVVHHWILYDGASMITSWSPGKEFETFPEGVGVYMPSSGTFRLNMHYYNVGNDKDEEDESGVEICVTRKQVEHVATTHMFMASATVPPQQMTVNDQECTVSGTPPEGAHLITSSPHMHSYGVGAKFEVIRQDGTVEMLHDTPFNWEDQSIKPIDVVIHDGDKVRTTCIYENKTNKTINFGESSEDEMCFNFARYYPRGGLNCGGFGGFGGLAF